jgi:hypothetical protein
MSISTIQEYKRYRAIKQLKMLRVVRMAREVALVSVAVRPLPVDKGIKVQAARTRAILNSQRA